VGAVFFVYVDGLVRVRDMKVELMRRGGTPSSFQSDR